MIAGICGKLEFIGADWAIIHVGGVSLQVYIPTSTLSTLGATGTDVKLHTHLQLKEDSATLYGFASPDELRLFQTLIGVSGLGPRLALAMLSVMSADQLSIAIATGSTELLTQVPGIGKKMASRLVLELKDKIAAGLAASPTTHFAQENGEVMAALAALGYSAAEVSRSVATIPTSGDLSIEEKIRLALAYFGGK